MYGLHGLGTGIELNDTMSHFDTKVIYISIKTDRRFSIQMFNQRMNNKASLKGRLFVFASVSAAAIATALWSPLNISLFLEAF